VTPALPAVLVTAVGILAGAVAAVAVVRWLRVPVRGALASAAVTVVAGAVLTVAGAVSGADLDGPFLIDLAAFAAPVTVALVSLTGSVLAGAAWAVIVLPVAAVVPLAATAGCAGTDCAIQDFGGGLPLAVSAAAFLLAVGVRATPPPTRLVPPLVTAVAAVVWLAAMEGAVDAYTPRLLLTGAIGAVSAALALTAVDALSRRPVRSAPALGLVAGVVAMLPGAAVLGWPWAIVVGLVAGAAGSAVAGRRAPGRIAPAALVVALIGVVAPVVVGDEVGLIITADVVTLGIALGAALGVIAVAMAAGFLVRLAIRPRTAARAARRPRP
jgi:ammonium transporter, Amt family